MEKGHSKGLWSVPPIPMKYSRRRHQAVPSQQGGGKLHLVQEDPMTVFLGTWSSKPGYLGHEDAPWTTHLCPRENIHNCITSKCSWWHRKGESTVIQAASIAWLGENPCPLASKAWDKHTYHTGKEIENTSYELCASVSVFLRQKYFKSWVIFFLFNLAITLYVNVLWKEIIKS